MEPDKIICALIFLVIVFFSLWRHEKDKAEKRIIWERNHAKHEAEDKVKREIHQHRVDTEAAFREREISIQQRENSVERRIHATEEKLRVHEDNLEQLLTSNLTAIPWLAGMMADFLTYDLEVEAKKLDWGSNIQREKKVRSIREIRADAKARIEQAKEAIYQLEYLRMLYPALDDVLQTDYKDLEFTGTIPEYDPTRDYLSKEEWASLSSVEKDQLALDRYIQSKNKSSWQIGRDYELAVAYEYSKKGYTVDSFGTYMKLEDLGRDIIAKKGDTTLIIQCKYWSKEKTIHEKHIFQLYGTVVSYCIEHNIDAATDDSVHGVFVTSTTLSPMARMVAEYLNVTVVERHKMVDFPRIKCNIGKGEFGKEKIYHLPMDLQYDVTKIDAPGEFYAFTVQEAIDHGFRRAFKWHGQ